MRMTPYLRMPSSRSFASDDTRLAHLLEKPGAVRLRPHGRSAAGRRPHGSDQRADDEAAPGDRIGEALRVIGRRIDADVRIEEEEIDAVEPGAVDFGGGRQVEHRLEVDRRFGAWASFPNQSGPHRVVQAGREISAHLMP